MMPVVYLAFEDVVAIHEVALEVHGGKGGFHAQELVESAVEMPKSAHRGVDLYPDLFDKAAAYLFFIASNHGFVDGNERAALTAALTFLSFNGHEVDIPAERWEETVALVLAIADGQLSREEATLRFMEFLASLGGSGG